MKHPFFSSTNMAAMHVTRKPLIVQGFVLYLEQAILMQKIGNKRVSSVLFTVYLLCPLFFCASHFCLQFQFSACTPADFLNRCLVPVLKFTRRGWLKCMKKSSNDCQQNKIEGWNIWLFKIFFFDAICVRDLFYLILFYFISTKSTVFQSKPSR